jgi:hypothetical protein
MDRKSLVFMVMFDVRPCDHFSMRSHPDTYLGTMTRDWYV